MTKYKRVPWYLRKRKPPPTIDLTILDSLSALDQLEPRYYYAPLGETYVVYERPRTSGILRTPKPLSLHYSDATAQQVVTTLNAIWAGAPRYEILKSSVIDIVLNKVIWTGKDAQDKAAELNAYERERLAKWR